MAPSRNTDLFRMSSLPHSISRQIAASLVLCTVLSAPIMYISARMVLITYASSDQYARIIENTRRDVTVITVVSVVGSVSIVSCGKYLLYSEILSPVG